MNTVTRTTKAGTTIRTVSISFALAGRCEVRVCETQGHKTTTTTYLLARQPSDFGAGFQVRKLGDLEETYDVLLNGRETSCNCSWGTYQSHLKPCRHIEMALQACRECKI